MTPYERGKADGIEAAARECGQAAEVIGALPGSSIHEALRFVQDQILQLGLASPKPDAEEVTEAMNPWDGDEAGPALLVEVRLRDGRTMIESHEAIAWGRLDDEPESEVVAWRPSLATKDAGGAG